MSSHSLFKTSFLLLTFLNLQHAFAVQGNSTDRGGGDVAVINDQVVLADPYFHRTDAEEGLFGCPIGTSGALAGPLVKELKRIGAILVSYGAKEHGKLRADEISEASAFIEEKVLSEAQYCFVDELPRRTRPLPSDAPAEARVEPIGYTEGKLTFIKASLFKRMNLREQAKLIVHERLHSGVGNVKYGPIADITNGIDTALSIYAQQSAGKLPAISWAEYTRLDRLRLALYGTGLSVNGGIRVHPNGGGAYQVDAMHSPTRIAASAYLGIRTLLPVSAVVGDQAVVLNSRFSPVWGNGVLSIGPRARIVNTWVSGLPVERVILLGEGARLLDSVLHMENGILQVMGVNYTGRLSLGKGAVVQQARLNVTSLILDEGASLARAWIHEIRAGGGSAGLSLWIRKNARVANLWDVNLRNQAKIGFWDDLTLDYEKYMKAEIQGAPLLDIASGASIDLAGYACTKRLPPNEERELAAQAVFVPEMHLDKRHIELRIKGRNLIKSTEGLKPLLTCEKMGSEI